MEGTHAVVNGVSNASNQIGASAEEMASITTDSNKAIAQQQAEIDQVATAINEMTSTIQEVARNTSSAAEMAREASEVAATGQNVVTSNREAMNSLAAKVEHESKVIKSLEQDSNNIGTVLGNCRTDQPAGVECRYRGGSCRRTRPWLCRGSRRGAHPSIAHSGIYPGNPDHDRTPTGG
jgi:ABC-type transporter Mla subunit MlaD